jgi:rRNA maturation endonuclease Nob1
MITLDPHTAVLAVTTLGVGYVMAMAGVQKSALEWRRRRRTCPSCGRHIEARICPTCGSA